LPRIYRLILQKLSVAATQVIFPTKTITAATVARFAPGLHFVGSTIQRVASPIISHFRNAGVVHLMIGVSPGDNRDSQVFLRDWS